MRRRGRLAYLRGGSSAGQSRGTHNPSVVGSSPTRPTRYSRSCQVHTQTSLPSRSARIQKARARSSLTRRPPAARPASTRASASSCGTVRSKCTVLRCVRGSSSCWNQTDGPPSNGSTRSGGHGRVVVPEDRLPERAHRGNVHRIDRDGERLDRALCGVRDGVETGRAHGLRDDSRQIDVLRRHEEGAPRLQGEFDSLGRRTQAQVAVRVGTGDVYHCADDVARVGEGGDLDSGGQPVEEVPPAEILHRQRRVAFRQNRVSHTAMFLPCGRGYSAGCGEPRDA